MQRKTLIIHAALLAAIATGAHGAPSAGQTYFNNNCASCHTVDPGLSSRAGPGLYGLLGRKLGSAPGFNYSEVLASAGAGGKVWTAEDLDVFLEDPGSAVPGTAMPVNVPAKSDREAVIAYLASLHGEGSAKAAPAAAPSGAAPGNWAENKPGKTYRISVDQLVAPFGTSSAGNGPKLATRPEGAMPDVPAGFKIGIFGTDPDRGRGPLRAPNGDIFLADPGKGQIRVFRQGAGDKAQSDGVFIGGLTRPYGMAFYPSNAHPKYLYVANVNSIVRIPYASGDLKARGAAEVIVPKLVDTTGGHVTRTLAFSPDDRTLFVSIGSATNYASDIGNKPPEPLSKWEAEHGVGGAWGVETDRAAVLAFSPDGKERRPFATGLRNCVGMLVYPATGDLMCSVNERDELGDNLPPDYITRVKKGGFYGWPWYYLGDHEDPRLKGIRPDLKGKAIVPDTLLQAHSAPLGMVVYHVPAGAKHAFGKEYEGDIFLALHGSWNRGTRTGYKVVRVFMKNGVPTGEYQDFVTGFVSSDRDVWGRPAGVAVAADGALIVADDGGGVLWRIAPER
ncbi:hypothetical protein GCM10027321_02990 [Massilia terrae]|uniref:PQQ-dependent sugar dehydrogenase n=1 Tax=Massilia terrae TaxID=1811224 RepID=A0ABT2CTN9_9BURK|nr:c-type cytochrome [Massilia terrae]MCS0657337.1 PQQ-dependent sugar dehydrogenase [Massilia terrae]